MTGEHEGKVAFVTGAARGQGRGLAVGFAEEGCDVVLCDIARQIETFPVVMGTREDLDETVAAVEALDRRCIAEVVDVRDLDALIALANRAQAELGRIDFLAAQAGIASFAPIDEMSADQWGDVLGTNLTGVFNAIRAVSPHMKAQGSGAIVATTSTQGRSAVPGIASYVAAKWGVIGLVKAASCDLSPFGIRVNGVAPTNVNTPMFMNDLVYRMFRPDLDNPTAEDLREVAQPMHTLPVGWVEVEDVVNAYLFLVSDKARNITGTVLDVAAGYSTRYTA
jgi:SDR family mycofactocin-dependent oxidoreductase